MTTRQVEYIEAAIRLHSDKNNKDVASLILNRREELNPCSHFTFGTLSNYVGQIRKKMSTSETTTVENTIEEVENLSKDTTEYFIFISNLDSPGLNIFLAQNCSPGSLAKIHSTGGIEEQDLLEGISMQDVQNALFCYGIPFEPRKIESARQEVEVPENKVKANSFDILVVNPNEISLDNVLTYRSEALSDTCEGLIVLFGDEARVLNIRELNSGNYHVDSLGGSKTEYHLFDAIDLAISTAILDNPEQNTNVDFNITIISKTGYDFGSVLQTKTGLSELIYAVKNRFKVNINIATQDILVEPLAMELNIDTSNSLRYSNERHLFDILTDARLQRNQDIANKTTKIYNYVR